MSVDTATETKPVFGVEVPQPRQFGASGGIMRRLNFGTGLIGGIGLAAIAGWVTAIVTPSSASNDTFAPMEPTYVYLAVLLGWAIGFMLGIGAFVGPLRWVVGRDITHDDAEYMAGKDLGRARYWKYTTDHKVVGIQYLIATMLLLGFAGLLAMLIRTELGMTWAELFSPSFYNSMIGTHGIAMIIAMIVAVTGPLGNFIVPMMIGARDMAYPRLNALSLWLLVAAIPMLISSMFMGGIQDGWSVYQPLASQAPIGMLGYQLTIITFAISTAIASVNLMTTILTMRAKGMTWSRTPIFVYGIFAASLMGLYAFPFFQYSQILGLSDRVFNTSFFNPLNGGSVWLYENLFWLLGHPEVYVIIIPSAAVALELMPVFLRKPLFSFNFAVAGIVGVVALSGLVWAHHMYMTGWAPAANYPFMLSTEMISIPVGFLVLVAIGTFWRGHGVDATTPHGDLCSDLQQNDRRGHRNLPLRCPCRSVLPRQYVRSGSLPLHVDGRRSIWCHGGNSFLLPENDRTDPRRTSGLNWLVDCIYRIPNHVHVYVRGWASGAAETRAPIRLPVQYFQLDFHDRRLRNWDWNVDLLGCNYHFLALRGNCWQ